MQNEVKALLNFYSFFPECANRVFASTLECQERKRALKQAALILRIETLFSSERLHDETRQMEVECGEISWRVVYRTLRVRSFLYPR